MKAATTRAGAIAPIFIGLFPAKEIQPMLSPYHFPSIAATKVAESFYVASDIKPKRRRRTKAAISSIRNTAKAILEESNPQTVRQVYYALTVKGAIAKTETEYQRTTVRLLTDMREAGELPFEWIADNTRWMRKPASFTGIERCLNSCAANYRLRCRPTSRFGARRTHSPACCSKKHRSTMSR
jgi:hypothetical protein